MAEWVKADIRFAALYSYRVPDTSPSYAPCSPLPSPAAIRLALVDAVIRHTGSLEEGRRMFDGVRAAPLEIQPPEAVSVLKFFIKRLKPEKPEKGKRTSVIESTGVREYCQFSGPITAWLHTEEPSSVRQAFVWLRRLGTTDSLAWCTVVRAEPDTRLCMRRVDSLPIASQNFARRAVITLHELKPDAAFDQVNPFFEGRRRANPFRKQVYVLPLIFERAGENWVRYRREPFQA